MRRLDLDEVKRIVEKMRRFGRWHDVQKHHMVGYYFSGSTDLAKLIASLEAECGGEIAISDWTNLTVQALCEQVNAQLEQQMLRQGDYKQGWESGMS